MKWNRYRRPLSASSTEDQDDARPSGFPVTQRAELCRAATHLLVRRRESQPLRTGEKDTITGMVKLDQRKAAKSIVQWAEMTRVLLDMKLEMIRSKHPGWSEEEIMKEISRQLRILRNKKRII